MNKTATRPRSNLSVSATPEALEQIDKIVRASPVKTSRSAVALAAMLEGLAAIAAKVGPRRGSPK